MANDARVICNALGIKILFMDVIREGSELFPRIVIIILSVSGHPYRYGPDWWRGKMRFEEVRRK